MCSSFLILAPGITNATYCLITIRKWCFTCGTLVKPMCVEAQHQIGDLLEEAEESQTELNEVLNGYKAGDAMRGRVDGELQTKLRAIEAQIAENNSGRRKIQSAVVSCEEMAKLSPVMKVSAVIRKEIKQWKKKMKEECEKAKNVLDCIAHSSETIVYNLNPFFVCL